MKISKFEDIESWKEARILVSKIYRITKMTSLSKEMKLSSQIQSAAVSVMSNIAEGFDRKSDKEFIRFLFISLSSASEVQSLLYVIFDQHYLSGKEFKEYYSCVQRIKNMILGLIRYLKN